MKETPHYSEEPTTHSRLFTVVNIAVKNILKDLGLTSDGCAGHSLGEWAAYADAGVISDEEVIKAVALRGKYMHEAGEKASGTGADSSMAAVIGLDLTQVEEAIKDVDGAFMANWNAPTQIRNIRNTGRSGGRRDSSKGSRSPAGFSGLRYPRPAHSPLLDEAKEKFTSYLSELNFKDPVKPLYSNVSGKIVTSGSEAKDLALKQIVSSVLWVDEEKNILADGYDRIIETGPGKVLSGLMKSFGADIAVQLCGTVEQIEGSNRIRRKFMLLKDKIAVVTGGSKGIGKAVVELFLKEGATVYYISRTECAEADKLAAIASEAGTEVIWKQGSVSDSAAMNEIASGILKEKEKIDIPCKQCRNNPRRSFIHDEG